MIDIDIAQITFYLALLILAICVLVVEYKKHSFREKTKNESIPVDIGEGKIKANNKYWDEQLWALRLFKFIKFWK